MERLSPTQASFRRDLKLVLEAMNDGKLVQKMCQGHLEDLLACQWGRKDIIILSHSYFNINCMSMGLG